MKELINIQHKLKAPKGRKNNFGNYKYRSCEDILEAVKPLLAEEECTLTLSDDMVAIGERIYVKAVATIRKGDESVTVTAYAREAETKKGMDDSQITGTASSYARKYALNGLFLIDDTKKADTDEYANQTKAGENNDEAFKMALTDAISVAGKSIGLGADIYWNKDNTKYNDNKKAAELEEDRPINKTEVKTLTQLSESYKVNTADICKRYKVSKLEDMSYHQYGAALRVFKSMEKKA